ncbi:hypothetical protein V2G26_011272 [Clonostachys chloroleuca]
MLSSRLIAFGLISTKVLLNLLCDITIEIKSQFQSNLPRLYFSSDPSFSALFFSSLFFARCISLSLSSSLSSSCTVAALCFGLACGPFLPVALSRLIFRLSASIAFS